MTTSGGRRQVAIIGGGIAGLAAAHRLIDTDVDVHLFERSDRLGGKIATDRMSGVEVPTGPDSFLARRPEMTELVVELGLESELISPAASEARLYRNGTLHPLPQSVLGIPTDIGSLAATGLVSPEGVARAEEDLERADDRPDGDESVGQLVRRRLGDEVLEYVVDPLLGGINAGDSDKLSVRWGAPQIGALRDRDPSLMRAAAAVRRAAPDGNSDAASSPVFLGLRGGFGVLTERLTHLLHDAPNVTVQLDSPVAIDRSTEGWVVGGRTFDRVIVAAPAHASAQLLAAHAPETADLLGAIDYSSVALLVLAFPRGSVPVAESISGVLVPRLEGLHVTAVSIASNKWPELAIDQGHLLRVSVGRRLDTRWVDMEDDELLEVVLGDLEQILGLSAPPNGPDSVLVSRWFDSLPQYDVGHGDRIDRAVAALQRDAPGVILAGSALRGLGLPACVGSGRAAADELLGMRVQ